MNICEQLCRLNPSTNIGRGTVQTFPKQAGSMEITLNSHCTGSIFCCPEPTSAGLSSDKAMQYNIRQQNEDLCLWKINTNLRSNNQYKKLKSNQIPNLFTGLIISHKKLNPSFTMNTLFVRATVGMGRGQKICSALCVKKGCTNISGQPQCIHIMKAILHASSHSEALASSSQSSKHQTMPISWARSCTMSIYTLKHCGNISTQR